MGPQGDPGPQGLQGGQGPIGPEGPPGALSGRQVVTAEDPGGGLGNSDSDKSATVVCPEGTDVTGGGALLLGGNGNPVLRWSYPAEFASGQTGWAAGMREVGLGTSEDWKLRVYAICVDAP